METMKEQGIMVCFNQEDKSKTSETSNCQNGASTARPTGSVEQTTTHVKLLT